MNTNAAQVKNSSRFSGIRGLGRGIALSSAVAVMGVSTLSAADASAAGVAHGVRYSAPADAGTAKSSPTDLNITGTSQLVVRDGASGRR